MRLITILGQTASGKTDLSLQLYHVLKDRGYVSWIVSCDSRQVYKGLQLGTNKAEGQWRPSGVIIPEGLTTKTALTKYKQAYHIHNIPHFLLDFVEPKDKIYSLADYLSDFYDLCHLADSQTKNKPDVIILVGGTGLYARAVTQDYRLQIIKPEYKPYYQDQKDKLSSLDLYNLQCQLEQCDPNWNQLNNSDKNNPRRLINRLLKLKSVQNNWLVESGFSNFSSLDFFSESKKFWLKSDQELLASKIKTRLEERLELGMLAEIQQTFEYLGYQRTISFGLEYKSYGNYLNNLIVWKDLEDEFLKEELRYAKKQLTWAKKEPDLIHISPRLPELLECLSW